MQKFSKKSSLALTLCILSAISSSGYAAEKDSLHQYNLDEYVVTATRTALTQKEVPQSVEVITKADIQNVGAISVRDVLKTATNLHIDDGGGGHGDQFTIRGSVTNDILILVNGRRIAGENIYPNGSSNTRILDRLNLSNVERIEIVRGPGGALYGSDAQGGVINIITKKSEKPEFIIGMTSGSREMSNYYHWDTGRDNKFSAVLDANFSKLRNFEGKAAGFTYGPKQSYTLDMDYDMDTKNRLNLVLDYDKENLQYQGTSSISKRIQNRKTAALTYEGESTNSKYSLTSTYSQFENETSDKKYKFWNVEARDSIQTAANNKVTFGTEFRVTEGSAYVASGSDRAEQYALYVQDEYRAGSKLLLIPSIRYDHHDSFGSHTSPNLGATYFIDDNSRFKANYGSAYRSPSVDELYGDFSHGGMFTVYGNPDLKPEKTRGYEFSYEHEFNDDTSTKVTYFKNKKKDAISMVELPGGGMFKDRRFVNIDRTSSEGIEFEVKHNLGNGFMLSGNYNWLDAKDESTGERLSYSARNTYVAKLQWTEPVHKEWSVTAWNKWYTDYHDGSTDSNSGNTFNFVVNKRWGDKYRVFAGIDNVFDKEISELSYYGRLWRVGAEMKF